MKSIFRINMKAKVPIKIGDSIAKYQLFYTSDGVSDRKWVLYKVTKIELSRAFPEVGLLVFGNDIDGNERYLLQVNDYNRLILEGLIMHHKNGKF